MRKILLLPAMIVFILSFSHLYAQKRALSVGDSCPHFTLKDQNDSIINIADLIGKKILVIYFYPKDESFICTKEACAFRDKDKEFQKLGAIVIGVNYGTVESHKKFCEKDNLPFLLLSDSSKAVLKMFGLKGGIASERATFVVDLTGQIVFTYDSMVNGAAHAEKALEYIREMKSKM